MTKHDPPSRLADIPLIENVELTNHCNLKCSFCPHPRDTRERMKMSPEFFRTYILPNLQRGKRVGLHGLGETLLHPRWIEIARMVEEEAGAIPELSHNGTLLRTDDQCRKLALSPIRFLVLNVTPWKVEDKKSHEIRENVLRYLRKSEKLKALGYRVPTVIVHICDAIGTDPEEYAAEELWPGADSVSIKFLDAWAGSMESLIPLTPEVDMPRPPCLEPWNRVSIQVNGDVIPCCRDAHGRYVYGNLTKASLREIWHSEKVERLRAEMLSGIYESEPCKSCREWYIPMDRRVADRWPPDPLWELAKNRAKRG